jgi:ribulose-phosphate 3-epimerase
MEQYSDITKSEKPKIIICPSILSADFNNLGRDVQIVSEDADWIHVDVMDGMFVPNISFGIPIVKAIRNITKLPLDVHLMIDDPIRYVEDFANAGADMIVVHSEACKHLHRVIQYIKSLGKNAGVAINPATPLKDITEILPYVDMVLLMTVNPGFGGQKYIPTMTKKVLKLRQIMEMEGSNSIIQVDGGIGPSNIKEIFDAGANAFVVGNSVYGTDNPVKAIKELRECVE